MISCCNDWLQPERFQDYCPNGLQVEGADRIERIVSGVTASQALVDAAIEDKAQLILVHHGYFWKGQSPRVEGMLKNRLKALLTHDINLLAYHLPLDAHPEFGNNTELAKQLDFQIESGLTGELDVSIGQVGSLATSLGAADLRNFIEMRLGRKVLHVPGGPDKIRRIAWCTGGAQGYIEKAAELEVDAFLTGEISEQTTHVARELGLHFYAAGHHATERYGVQALGKRLAARFGLEHRFIDIDNPA